MCADERPPPHTQTHADGADVPGSLFDDRAKVRVAWAAMQQGRGWRPGSSRAWGWRALGGRAGPRPRLSAPCPALPPPILPILPTHPPTHPQGWNLRHLSSLLSRTLVQHGVSMPGVLTPYLSVGAWRSTFAWWVGVRGAGV